ncbi:MAG TPA: tetratricopeptide repeat protein, partial [Enhygromyxa sp.]|nr:tetratricopeptide repeat protein [Enhygromyxa sp.]
MQRDLFVRDLGCSWVVLIDPYGSRKLQSIAPDFCDFASLWIRAPGAGVELLEFGHEVRPPITPDVARSVVLDVDESGPGLLRRAAEATAAGQFVEARDLLTRFDLVADADDKHQGLALLLRGNLERLYGNLDAARRASEQALARSLARGDQAKAETAAALHLLGDVLLDQGQYQQARSSLERALEIGTQERADIAALLARLAQVHSVLGNDEEARRSVERALEFQDDPAFAAVLRDDLDEARRILEQELEAQEQSSETESPLGMSGLLRMLAVVLHQQGDLDAARRQMERSLEIRSAALGTERHPIVVTSLRELGSIMLA